MKNEDFEETKPAIGFITSIDAVKLKDAVLAKNEDAIRVLYRGKIYNLGKMFKNLNRGAYDELGSWYSSKTKDEEKTRRLEIIDKNCAELSNVLNHAAEFGDRLSLYYTDETESVVGWGITYMVVPTVAITYTLYETYENDLLCDIKQKTGISSAASHISDPTLSALSQTSESSSLSKIKESLVEKQRNIDDEVASKKAEIEKIKEEAERQIRKFQDELDKKMAILQKQKDDMLKILFGMETEIYNIRCFIGDAVTVVPLRKGKAAPIESPVVLYQKLRFLDEDFAKVNALYSYDLDKSADIERILKDDDFIFNQFCPSEKCVTLLKVSKDGCSFAKSDGNYLDRYKYYHGNQIAILLRNGENLYIGWTEQDKIYLKENFMLFSESKTTTYNEDEKVPDSDDTITDPDYTKGLAWKQFFSRRFLLTILQGFTDFKQLISFPETVNFYNPSKYIIYSTAENALADTRFGTLYDFMKTRNEDTMVGDYVLPLMNISGSTFMNTSYSSCREDFSRGRGDKNRVRDCQISKDVQKINLVEPVYTTTTFYKRNETEEKVAKLKEAADGLEVRNNILTVYGGYVRDVENYNNAAKIIAEGGDAAKEYTCKHGFYIEHKKFTGEYLYYVSVKKTENWRDGVGPAYANVEIYPNEFINLTYMCSSMLRYFVETKQIGNVSFGCEHPNYSYIVRSLQLAMLHVGKRERDELIRITVLDRKTTNHPNLDLILIDWKYKNKVRLITDYQAKRFVKYIQSIPNLDTKYTEIIMNWNQTKEETLNAR